MIIKIEASDKAFSAHGGMILFNSLMDKIGVRSLVERSLPSLVSGTGRSWDKFRGLLSGFYAGAECLDDMEVLSRDDGFNASNDDNTYTPKAYGDFLRCFSRPQIRELQGALIDEAFMLRHATGFESSSMVFDFDSTSNEQYGEKMEGVAQNYKFIDCLDTFQVFDELGFQYFSEVRPGNTTSASGVGQAIHMIFSRLPRTKTFKRMRFYGRADSAFCNTEFFNACAAKQIGFVTSMRLNMFEPLVSTIREWRPSNPSKETRIKFYDGRECEIGETIYRTENGAELLRVAAIRAVKKGFEGLLFKGEEHYDYRAWVSNILEHEKSAEKLIKFYRGRGNSENYIRELKYGFDLKHYPCLKLDANRVYGLIASCAYNLTRFIATKTAEKRVHFAKAIRNRFLRLPVQVIRHAREVVFRFQRRHYEEVQRWLVLIENIEFGFA